MPHSVLITGGTGLIGSYLSPLLRDKGYTVRHLSRRRNLNAEFPAYSWDIAREQIDPDAIDDSVQTIIHLAGAGIADRRWSTSRKADIVGSRVASTALLARYLQQTPKAVRIFIGGSATGYYGNSGDRLMSETDSPADDSFLSHTTRQWEQAYAQLLLAPSLRSVVLRTGVVLAREGGALPQMSMSAQWGIAAYFGTGEQYIPWIHIADMCQLLLHAIETETMQGVYNAVAPQAATNKVFMQALAQTFCHRSLSIPVPAFALRAAMGEMADVVLHGCCASADKVLQAGFAFLYPDLSTALASLCHQKD